MPADRCEASGIVPQRPVCWEPSTSGASQLGADQAWLALRLFGLAVTILAGLLGDYQTAPDVHSTRIRSL